MFVPTFTENESFHLVRTYCIHLRYYEIHRPWTGQSYFIAELVRVLLSWSVFIFVLILLPSSFFPFTFAELILEEVCPCPWNHPRTWPTSSLWRWMAPPPSPPPPSRPWPWRTHWATRRLLAFCSIHTELQLCSWRNIINYYNYLSSLSAASYCVSVRVHAR